MISIYSGDKAIKQLAPEVYSFFPYNLFNDVNILIFHGIENCEEEEIFLKKILWNCIFVRGFHRQGLEEIKFLSPEFDYLYDIFFDFPSQGVVDSFDLIVSPNEKLRNDFHEIEIFIHKIKKYRLLMKHGKQVELSYPFLWEVFRNGFFTKCVANYMLENSNFIIIPKIGLGGVGKFSLTCISSKKGEFIDLARLIANGDKIKFSEISSKEELPFY